MTRMFKFARKLGGGRKPAPQVDSLHSMERMRAILDRERMRSDRGNSMFALLTFMLAEPYSDEQFECLGQVLKQRLRVTDDAGILGPNCVGAVLPETSVVGAWNPGGSAMRSASGNGSQAREYLPGVRAAPARGSQRY